MNIQTWLINIITTTILFSMLEILLHNGKTKEVALTVMGLILVYIIVSPLIINKDALIYNVNTLSKDMKKYETNIETDFLTYEDIIKKVYIEDKDNINVQD